MQSIFTHGIFLICTKKTFGYAEHKTLVPLCRQGNGDSRVQTLCPDSKNSGCNWDLQQCPAPFWCIGPEWTGTQRDGCPLLLISLVLCPSFCTGVKVSGTFSLLLSHPSLPFLLAPKCMGGFCEQYRNSQSSSFFSSLPIQRSRSPFQRALRKKTF